MISVSVENRTVVMALWTTVSQNTLTLVQMFNLDFWVILAASMHIAYILAKVCGFFVLLVLGV